MSQEWYCLIQDREIGPFPSSQLKVMAQKGRLSPEDKIRKDGTETWITARKVRGLFPEPGPASAPEAGPSPGDDAQEERPAHPKSKPADTPPVDPPSVVRISVKKKRSADAATSEPSKHREPQEEQKPHREESPPAGHRDVAGRERRPSREKPQDKDRPAAPRPKPAPVADPDEPSEPRRPSKKRRTDDEETMPADRSDVHHEESAPDSSPPDGFSFLDEESKPKEPPPPPKTKAKSKHKAPVDEADDEVTEEVTDADGPKSSASSASGGLGFLDQAYDEPAVMAPQRGKDASGRAKSLPKSAAVPEVEAKREAQRKLQNVIMLSALGGVVVVVLLAGIIFFMMHRSGSEEAAKSEVAADKEKKEKKGNEADSVDSDESWFDATRATAVMGSVAVRIVSVELAPPKLADGGVHKDTMLLVHLELCNTGKQKVGFASWNGSNDKAAAPWLLDAAGNKYPLRRFKQPATGQVIKTTTIAPAATVEDLLIFSKPTSGKTDDLKLRLPSIVVGAKDSANFFIPARMISSEDKGPGLAGALEEAKKNAPAPSGAPSKAGPKKTAPAAAKSKKPEAAGAAKEKAKEKAQEEAKANVKEKEKTAQKDVGDKSEMDAAPAEEEKAPAAKADKPAKSEGTPKPTRDPKKDFGIDPDADSPF